MTLADFHIGIIDIGLVIIILLFAISGFKNGFLKEFVNIGTIVGGIILTLLLANWVEEVLISTTLNTILFDTLKGSVFTGNAVYETIIDNTLPDALALLTSELTQLGLPGFLATRLADNLIVFNGPIGDGLATLSTNFIMFIISYLGTFLIACLLLAIVSSLLVKLSKDVRAIKFVDSLLGIVLGLGRAALLVGALLVIVIPLTYVVPAIDDFITSDLALNEDVFSIGKYIYTLMLGFIESFITI